jgi:hypothetical protein
MLQYYEEFIPFLLVNYISLYGYTWKYHSLFICLPVYEHLGFFKFWAASNKVSVNIHVQDFVWTYAFISHG